MAGTQVTWRVALLVSLAAKLLLWGWITSADPGRFWDDGDTRSYVNPALSLVEQHVFAVAPDQPHTPEVNRTPGYPAFLAASFILFGKSLAVVVLLQIILSVGTLALVGSLSQAVFGRRRVATLTVWIGALDLLSLTFSQILLTETLFTFVLAAAAWAGLRARRGDGGPRWAAACGLLLGLGALVRPIGYYLPLPLALVLGVCGASGRRSRFVVSLSVAALIPAAIVLGGWQLRNHATAGVWAFSTEISGEVDRRAARIERLASLNDDGSDIRGRGQNRDAPVTGEREGAALLLRHPVLFLRTSVWNAARTMAGPGEHRFIRLLGYPRPDAPGLDLRRVLVRQAQGQDRRWLDFDWFADKWLRPPRWPILPFALSATHLAVVDLGLLFWLVRALGRRRMSAPDLVVMAILGYLLVTSGAGSRFRVPIMPFASIYAAAGYFGLDRCTKSVSRARKNDV